MMKSSRLNLMDRQKGLAPILIVLLIALVVGGYLLYQKQFKPVAVTQQKAESSIVSTVRQIASSSAEIANNWKEYTNTFDKYTLKYPPEWVLQPTKGGADPSSFPPYFNSPCNHKQGRCAGLGIYGTLDATKELDSYFSYKVSGNNDNIVSKTEIDLGGEKAIRVEYGSPRLNQHGGVDIEINVIHNKKVYRFSLWEASYVNNKVQDLSSVADWQYRKIFDQILSTFKFTN